MALRIPNHELRIFKQISHTYIKFLKIGNSGLEIREIKRECGLDYDIIR